MNFDPENKIIQLCAQGMISESNENTQVAKSLFLQAWANSCNDFEKFISAHYIARHQDTIEDKLKWDEKALSFALQINDDNMKPHYPSLYLNIAKDYEELNDFDKARENYHTALIFSTFLPEDGYGKMIKSGIRNGIERVSVS